MRASAALGPVFFALALACCTPPPATQSFDLIVRGVVPGRVALTEAHSISLFVQAQNLCEGPVLLLDGVPYPEPIFPSPKGLRIPAGQHLVDGFRRAHPDVDGCAFDTTVRLTIDCSGQTPALGIPASVEHAEYGVASDATELRLTLDGRASVTAWAGGEDVSPFFPLPFEVDGRVDEASAPALLDGKPVPVQLQHQDEAGRTIVTLLPGERLAPGPHMAMLPGGAAGERLMDRRCLPDEGATVSFTVRGAEEPDLRAWIETSPRRRLRWEDFGRLARYQVFLAQPDGEDPMLLNAVGGLPQLDLPGGLGPCFRVHAIVGNNLVAASPTVCEEP